MLLRFVGFLLVGRLVIFFIQEFPLHKLSFIGNFFSEGKFLKELFDCDLCLGVWIYWFLSIIIGIDVIYDMFCVFIPIIGNLITGMIASFLVHIFRIGWITKFGITVVE